MAVSIGPLPGMDRGFALKSVWEALSPGITEEMLTAREES
jgi:hypothetical protein